MKTKTKIAIIGCGMIADAHVNEIRKIKDTAVVAVCDKEQLMAAQLAERYGIPHHFESFEQLVENIDLSLITKATFYQIYKQLKLFNQALKLDGISSAEIQQQLDLLAHSLEIRGFTFTQYLDIFKGFALAVKNIINDYFNNTHEENLSRILADIDVNRIQAKYLPRETGFDTEKLVYRVSEIFFRDQIALSLGLQQLDLFISRILNTLFQQADKLPKDNLHKLLIYDPENAMTSIHHVGRRVNGSIHLGNKGLNLVKLKEFLSSKRGFLLALLENPSLLEHDRFTDLLWAVTHLDEELEARQLSVNLPLKDLEHIGGDIQRMYDHLASEWLDYVEHLKLNYPYLFSLILRTHPFQEHPSPLVS